MAPQLAKSYHPSPDVKGAWWQNAVFYQIYPRSFQDTNGDGIGDLQGISDRLDYLVDLGIDAIWISPIYPSPMVDFGYDVADFCDIHPMFGDLATFDRLLGAAHERQLKVILDYVPNHSSDQHPWFQESRRSRDNPKRDWYIWHPARADGSVPNNWESIFGGSVWAWDEATGEYYLHTFVPEQPDLNWRNPAVVAAMHDVIRFWLDRGVDGLRVDAVTCLMKDQAFRDNPPAEPGSYWTQFDIALEPRYTMHLPETFRQVQLMRAVFDEYEARVHIGETGVAEAAELVPYYGDPLNGYHIPFNFLTLHADWDAAEMRRLIERYYEVIPAGGWPNFVFGNHDVHRLASRFGVENHRSVAMLLLTLWGVPTIYYGDELGMQDVAVPPERRVDPWGLADPGSDLGRDPERTPMQWDSTANAGFTTGEPWLPLAPDFAEVNVAGQLADEQSTLAFYRRLLRLRREQPALTSGTITLVDGLAADLLAYVRAYEGRRLLIILNFGDQKQAVDISGFATSAQSLLATTFGAQSGALVQVAPHESILLELS
ncbi:MAG: DUF3459 domain-containing protein [Ardenticatenales bacterium]|nr:DUF3459 domain-containing protein [Ardenticatenales bacterium]